MATAFNTGQMMPITKDSGTTIRLRAKAHFGMLKEMFIEVSLRMIWLTVMENILTSTAVNIKENLMMMYKKAMVKKSG